MSITLTVKKGKKTDRKDLKAKRVGKARLPGPITAVEAEGQSQWQLFNCPWCGGIIYRVEKYDYCQCEWCGTVFECSD